MNFDPNAAASADAGIFGLPFSEAESKIVLLPVPWEVTTSYGVGASNGPEMIFNCSGQVDLFDFETGRPYEAGIFMRPIPEELKAMNKNFKAKAQKIVKIETGEIDDDGSVQKLTQEVNEASRKMTDWVYSQCREILSQNKGLGLIGGDHSTPLGAIHAISEKYKGNFGILHLDAHADLRNAYQGFEQSHASIMYNVMTAPFKPKKLVQVGIRDFGEDEYNFIMSKADEISTFFDIALKKRLLRGESWASICESIVQELPQNVYISFDIDGLEPAFCPNTGTPVPGGLTVDQVFYLFSTVIESGRKLVGFDLNEVSSGEAEHSEWDGNVGARVLYKLCGWLQHSMK